MTTPVRQYTDEIHEKYSYWATWLPSSRLRLGDCGPVRDRVFQPETTLEDFNIDFRIERGSNRLDLDHRSQGGVDYQVQFAAGSKVIPQIPQGTAGIEVSFERKNGVVFVLREGYEHRIENIRELRQALLDCVMAGYLPREYAIVTHVIDASSGAVLISHSSGAKFVASAEADLNAGLIDLANTKAALSRVAGENLQTEIVAAEGLTPLFKLVGFKKEGWFWGSPRIADLGFEDDSDLGELSEVEPSETDAED